jgi:hypothetical protein
MPDNELSNPEDYGLDGGQWQAKDAPPIVPGGPTAPIPPPTQLTINPNLRATLPLSVQLEPSLTKQTPGGSLPTIPVMPVSPSGQAGLNAAATSIAQAVVASAVTPQKPLPNNVKTVSAGGVSIASGAISQTIIGMARAFTVLSVVCSGPLQLRLYSTAAAQTADLNRPNSVAPTPGTDHGVICDLYLQSSSQYLDWTLSPAAPGCNDDASQSTNVYCSITNLSGSTAAPTAAITYVGDSTPN